MNIQVHELEKLFLKHKGSLTILPIDKLDKHQIVYLNKTQKECNQCKVSILQDDPYVEGMYLVEGVQYALCKKCLVSELNKLGYEIRNIYTKATLIRTLERVRKGVKETKDEIRVMIRNSNAEDKKSLTSTYIKKVQTPHTGLTVIMRCEKEVKCTTCKTLIKHRETHFNHKRYGFKTRKLRDYKVCIPCVEDTIQHDIGVNKKVVKELNSILD